MTEQRISLTRNQRIALRILRSRPEHKFSPAWLATLMQREGCSTRQLGATRAGDKLVELGLARRTTHDYANHGYQAITEEATP